MSDLLCALAAWAGLATLMLVFNWAASSAHPASTKSSLLGSEGSGTRRGRVGDSQREGSK